jgi:alanine racemase
LLNYLEINLPNLTKNLQLIQNQLAENCIISPVLKANAYSLGSKEISQTLARYNCNDFWVFSLDEALELRQTLPTCNIYIFQGLTNKNDIKIVQQNNITPVVTDLSQLAALQNNCKNMVVNFDTGMGREGIFLDDAAKIAPKISSQAIIMSHLACADEPDNNLNSTQLNDFLELRKYFPKNKYSLANSAGISLGNQYHLDMVRPGGTIYGVKAAEKCSKPHNVVSFYAQVLNRKILTRNSAIGYNATYHAKKGDKILIVHAGYFEGFTRHLSNKHCATHKNYKLPFIGKISMNAITLCANALPNNLFETIKYVELIGEKNTINEVAKFANIDAREVLTNLNNVKNKVYIEK